VTGTLAAGLVLGLVSAGALGGGFALQHRGAVALPPLSVRRPLRSLGALFRQPLWLGGSALGLSGWAAYIEALRLAPLSLVQAASAGGIVVLALAGGRPSRRERAGVVAALSGLALLGLSLAGESGAGAPVPAREIVLWLAGSAVAAAVVAGPGAARIAPGAGLGVAAGILYAAGDVATKEAVAGGTHLLFVPAVLAASGLGFVDERAADRRRHGRLRGAVPGRAGRRRARRRVRPRPRGRDAARPRGRARGSGSRARLTG